MVHIIAEKNIYDYADEHSVHKKSLEKWVSLVQQSTWNTPQNIVETFGTIPTDFIGNDRVVINVKGNHIRIIAKYLIHAKLIKSRLYIKWIGSHSEYDKLNKLGKQYTIDMFK
jgi:mRNA interferase HigB